MPVQNAKLSPLRYPGSKAILTNYISSVLEENYLTDCTIVEPYAGSAVVSLALLESLVAEKAILVERDPLVYSFWQSVFNHTYLLIEKIYNLPITIDTWNAFQIYRKCDNISSHTVVDLGLAGLFYNRTNFSGILKAGPLGGHNQSSQYKIDCRFNKHNIISQIERLSKFKNRVEVFFGDAMEFLKQNKKNFLKGNFFLYADPPYYLKGKSLYRYWYEHKEHKALAKFLLSSNCNWLVSYDDHAEIRKMYSNEISLIPVYFDYSLTSPRRERELLISNLALPPIAFCHENLQPITTA
ncbi:D12 class N6 adenine-specific DNA methyltransferase [Desulforamulus reducens MI-1]|uniref:site-specific DNA-methyltransferase (adenine-specific) n=1 Tax=Desulforamulus reducens (strain ATCC BAA-1160 / DSM 100696 / MI-1) TaxID=349161 RepID=A4J2W2_DESRM|nr:DNA adenine methylase [Desulforamulus reducens]ABO49415.1 D12 class N6 adenine-specific DNA methyltransferase [Desulforamulus reducens MI-1]